MNETQQKHLKIWLAVLTVLNLAAAAALVVAFHDLNQLKNKTDALSQPAAQEPAASQAESSAEIQVNPAVQTDPALYKAQCKEIDYETFARDSDAMKRQYFTFTGKILQAMEGHYRLGVRSGSSYSDVVYLDYTPAEGEERILENDIVTVWGMSMGLYTYTTVNEKSITVPRLDVGVLERMTPERLAEIERARYTQIAFHETQEAGGMKVTASDLWVRPAEEADLEDGEDPAEYSALFFTLDFLNSGEEEARVSLYSMRAYADGYETVPTVSSRESPGGFSRLNSTTLETGYGARGHVMLIVPKDWKTAELRPFSGIAFRVTRPAN